VKAYRFADSQTATLAEWNYDLLPLELKDLAGMDFDLSLPGGTGRERTGSHRVGKRHDKARRLWWNAIEETTIDAGFGPDLRAVATPRDRLSV
jgi:hypothetical protein